MKRKSLSEETKKKISLAHIGKKLSKEHINNLSISHKGKIGINSSNWKGGLPICIDCEKILSSYNSKRCKKCNFKSSEWKENCKKRTTGKKQSQETIQKRVLKNTGKKRTLEQRLRIGDAQRGEKAHNWLGGKSLEGYHKNWTETLKRSIRERDNYICQICDKTQIQELEEIEKKLSVHHIDYNKENCNPKNLITLCFKCHSETNYNREYWVTFFKNK